MLQRGWRHSGRLRGVWGVRLGRAHLLRPGLRVPLLRPDMGCVHLLQARLQVQLLCLHLPLLLKLKLELLQLFLKLLLLQKRRVLWVPLRRSDMLLPQQLLLLLLPRRPLQAHSLSCRVHQRVGQLCGHLWGRWHTAGPSAAALRPGPTLHSPHRHMSHLEGFLNWLLLAVSCVEGPLSKCSWLLWACCSSELRLGYA